MNDYLVPSPYGLERGLSNYSGPDSEELLKRNKYIMPPQWRFHDTPITYKWNSGGYRMRELEDIDYSNYIAFFGCSFTVGTGLPLEDTFAYRIAQQLNLGENYVNAAIGGSSPSLVALNVTRLLERAPMPPKAIVINWPPIHRTHYWWKGQIYFMLPNFNQSAKDPRDIHWRPAYEATITEDSHVLNTFRHLVTTVRTLCRLSGIQLIQFTSGWPSVNPNINQQFTQDHPDIPAISTGQELFTAAQLIDPLVMNRVFARDWVNPSISQNGTRQYIVHPGIIHQDNIVDHFTKEYRP
jgi:hypothetical protein